MNVALCFDSLLQRSDAVFLLELTLSLFPHAEIYTISHNQGAILGRIETRPIVSSFLTKRVQSTTDLERNFWILPSAIKNIPLHPSIEKVIVFSQGYIHGLKFAAHVESYLYLIDWHLIEQKKMNFFQRLFAPYVNDWREKSLTHFKKISISSESLKKELNLPNAEIISPTFRTEEYPFVKDENHQFIFEHHLLYTHGLTEPELKVILECFIKKGEMVRLIGPDEHLTNLKKQMPTFDFVGDHCEATSALYSHQAKAIWDFSTSFFPSHAFGGLCTGRPVVVLDSTMNREFLTYGIYFLSSLGTSAIESMISEVENSFLSFDRRVLRRLGLKWNERLFKSKMAKFLNLKI